jgi:uncharacterized membrane protein
MEKTKNKTNIKTICFTALMAALVFVFTFTFKIPIGAQGYTHLGDAVIFLSVWLIGSKRACFSAGLGAALADFALGYTIWIVPTFIVKFLTVIVLGIIAEHIFKHSTIGYIVGAIVAAGFHIGGYSLAWYILAGKAGVVSAIIPLIIQTVVGVGLAGVFVFVLSQSGVGAKLKKMAV